MKRVLRDLSVLVLSVAITNNAIAIVGEQGHELLTYTYSQQLKDKRLYWVLAALGGAMFFFGSGFAVGHFSTLFSLALEKADKKKSDAYPLAQNDVSRNVRSNFSELIHTTPATNDYQKTITSRYNLMPFNLSDDDYADAGKKLKYLWARATFIDDHPLHLDEGDLQPALFPLNTAYYPSNPYGSATQLCISSLPAPLTKKFRCNDQQLTGFCRVKFKLDGKTSTLVGMLANTPDNVSGCLLSSRKTDYFLASLGDETLLPRDILVTDKNYYQINVIYGKVSYQFQEWQGFQVPFASTVLLSGSLRHETLCKDDASPGTEWYNDDAQSGEYGCAGLTAEANPTGNTSYFAPFRQKAISRKQSSVTWQRVPTKKAKGETNIEVEEYFCSPKKPYKEFILGSLAGLGADKYCSYIGTSGKSGFVATNQDGSIASDYLTPSVDGDIGWQDFEDDLPEKAIIAGYSFSDLGQKITKVPVYFCRFVNNGYKTFGKYFEEGKVCKASFATPGGYSHALVDSKTFEILVRK
ncbi:hypothetical protein [Endozoicomonas sp. ISHI1]|uniref:hypothetical protein n=1 Tax=Endozoicomonas sp. ISHI1 TaxID=2825882 RepID=UPI0021493056|nr:hypothetical protein [Endozoicomonas sp. ISHI1]